MGFWIILPEAYEQETEEHRTRTEGYDEEGNYKFTTWSSTSGNTTSYWEAIIYLMGMFDVAEIDTTLVGMKAPAEGGVVTVTYNREGEEVEDNALILRSSRPFMGDDETANYEIVGLPSWLKIQSVEEITDSNNCLTRITLMAEPYNGSTPEGRQVSLSIRSDYGACTDTVTIQQIPMVGDSFTIVSVENKNISFTIIDTEDYTCEITDTDITEDGIITIPASIWEFEVEGIADQAFADRDDLTDITIDFAYNSCGGNIGKEAFKGCTNLRSITIGENASCIGDQAFEGCGNIETVNSLVILNRLWSFNDNAFDASVYENAMLIVPDDRVEQYEETNGWNNFQNIMDEKTAAGINMPLSTTHDKASDIYMFDGRRADKAQRGINIIRNEDGTVKKVVN